jgi:hypothetical protein
MELKDKAKIIESIKIERLTKCGRRRTQTCS